MPFRRAKLTACRKVRGIYRPYRAKSSAYGRKTPMAQAHLRYRAGAELRRLHALFADNTSPSGDLRKTTKRRGGRMIRGFRGKSRAIERRNCQVRTAMGRQNAAPSTGWFSMICCMPISASPLATTSPTGRPMASTVFSFISAARPRRSRSPPHKSHSGLGCAKSNSPAAGL